MEVHPGLRWVRRMCADSLLDDRSAQGVAVGCRTTAEQRRGTILRQKGAGVSCLFSVALVPKLQLGNALPGSSASARAPDMGFYRSAAVGARSGRVKARIQRSPSGQAKQSFAEAAFPSRSLGTSVKLPCFRIWRHCQLRLRAAVLISPSDNPCCVSNAWSGNSVIPFEPPLTRRYDPDIGLSRGSVRLPLSRRELHHVSRQGFCRRIWRVLGRRLCGTCRRGRTSNWLSHDWRLRHGSPS